MRLAIFLFLGVVFSSSCTTTKDLSKSVDINTEPLTVILVRHAEKQRNQSNPALTEAGQKRADRLAVMLEKIDLDAVFSTSYRRTEATAKPTAVAHELPIQSYDPKNLVDFAEMLKSDYASKTVLVVGHSNSTPALTGLLEDSTSYDSFDESDYGNIVIVTIPANGIGKTLFLRF